MLNLYKPRQGSYYFPSPLEQSEPAPFYSTTRSRGQDIIDRRSSQCADAMHSHIAHHIAESSHVAELLLGRCQRHVAHSKENFLMKASAIRGACDSHKLLVAAIRPDGKQQHAASNGMSYIYAGIKRS